jgi:hypothetical protein
MPCRTVEDWCLNEILWPKSRPGTCDVDFAIRTCENHSDAAKLLLASTALPWLGMFTYMCISQEVTRQLVAMKAVRSWFEGWSSTVSSVCLCSGIFASLTPCCRVSHFVVPYLVLRSVFGRNWRFILPLDPVTSHLNLLHSITTNLRSALIP